MRYAIVSDLHANLQAWLAIDKDIRNHGIDSVICLGDIVGYGPNPQAVLDSIRHRSHGIVLGDHDAVVAGLMPQDTFDDDARRLLDWTIDNLDDEAGAFLSSVPYKIGDPHMLFVHAEAEQPERYQFIFDIPDARINFNAARQQVTFIGHTHVPGIFISDPTGQVTCHPPKNLTLEEDHRYIVSVGSVGDPLDGNPQASYCIYDSDRKDLVFRRVHFDFNAYENAIAKNGIRTEPCCLSIIHADIAKSAINRNVPSVLPNLRPSMHTRGSGIISPVRAPAPAPSPLPVSRQHPENKSGTVKARSQKPSAEILGKTGEHKQAPKAKPKKTKRKRPKKKAKRRKPTHSPQKVVPLPPPPKATQEGNFIVWAIVIILSIVLLTVGGGLAILALKKPAPAYEFLVEQLNVLKAKEP